MLTKRTIRQQDAEGNLRFLCRQTIRETGGRYLQRMANSEDTACKLKVSQGTPVTRRHDVAV